MSDSSDKKWIQKICNKIVKIFQYINNIKGEKGHKDRCFQYKYWVYDRVVKNPTKKCDDCFKIEENYNPKFLLSILENRRYPTKPVEKPYITENSETADKNLQFTRLGTLLHKKKNKINEINYYLNKEETHELLPKTSEYSGTKSNNKRLHISYHPI
ncbi:PIR Superfamily Protein [Plasmodium ovale curtisi]|uniref:PIR Superfamily Protein n=1 Tax=Plasmodium ovale curtisi TaxID=864141 RepID=A0A1A8XAH2_PLAOA|nr:PIR Superfamily Protein [Plasmodium ovale curtisi]SBT02263.1 PIR Superfamily Protein [Plasmodium ovale curtisi]